MAFQVFLTDNINLVELDTEDIDINSVFSIADITDISTRKDKIQSIRFKGTKTNDYAFGNMFDFGKTSDFDQPNKLFFNYNPLRSVTALVYEDSELIFKGSLRISEINIDKLGQRIYNTILTGPVTELKTLLQDKYLHDLDFSDLKHLYDARNIFASWNNVIGRFDVATQTYYTTPFAYGSGYVYPLIDYGILYTGSTGSTMINIQNFKPAIYVKEYLNRIFDQPELTGYTYEISGSDYFKEMFNHLIIPDTQEGLKTTVSGFVSTYSMLTGTTSAHSVSTTTYNKLLPVNIIVHPPVDLMGRLMEADPYVDVLNVLRDFKSSSNVSVNLTTRNVIFTQPSETLTCKVKLVKRSIENNNNANSGWASIADREFIMNSANGFETHNINFDIDMYDFNTTDQVGIMVSVPEVTLFRFNPSFELVRTINYTANTVQLSVPKNIHEPVMADVFANTVDWENLTPKAPVNIKQLDFLKTILAQFNMYMYPSQDNSKHLIFQTYDDYYAYATPQNIQASALDWTGKIDYSHGLTVKSNINLPKNYIFTYKEDVDYLNDYYKNKFNEVYGQYSFTDQYGLRDTKKVETVFSSLIVSTELGNDRRFPMLYKVENNQKKKTKTNIRMGYYNGVVACDSYSIYAWGLLPEPIWYHYDYSVYPQVSNYFVSGGTALNNLHFGSPAETYFALDDGYIDCPTSYQNYYSNQIADLTNPDVIYIECNALLTPLDIANLDLRIPIFIDTGKFGSSYFKVNSVEYTGQNQPSKVTLQRIVF